jgi:hypothetical protein
MFISYLAKKIKQYGHYSMARYYCRMGLPLETFLIAFYRSQK